MGCVFPEKVPCLNKTQAMTGLYSSILYCFQGPRTLGRSSQGRSLSSLWQMDPNNRLAVASRSSLTTTPLVSLRGITYNHANTKTGVRMPQYYYRGGPDLTHTILGQCWRLFINCKEQVSDSGAPLPHPCCQLASNPGPQNLLSSRLSRWLH